MKRGIGFLIEIFRAPEPALRPSYWPRIEILSHTWLVTHIPTHTYACAVVIRNPRLSITCLSLGTFITRQEERMMRNGTACIYFRWARENQVLRLRPEYGKKTLPRDVFAHFISVDPESETKKTKGTDETLSSFILRAAREFLRFFLRLIDMGCHDLRPGKKQPRIVPLVMPRRFEENSTVRRESIAKSWPHVDPKVSRSSTCKWCLFHL